MPRHIMTDINFQPRSITFKKPIFEDSFIEPGMRAKITKVEYSERDEAYIIYFDLSDYFEHNKVLLTESYFPNKYTEKLLAKPMYTALEANAYTSTTSEYLFVGNGTRDDVLFNQVLQEFCEDFDPTKEDPEFVAKYQAIYNAVKAGSMSFEDFLEATALSKQ